MTHHLELEREGGLLLRLWSLELGLEAVEADPLVFGVFGVLLLVLGLFFKTPPLLGFSPFNTFATASLVSTFLSKILARAFRGK